MQEEVVRVSLAGEGREEANWRSSGDKLSEAPWFPGERIGRRLVSCRGKITNTAFEEDSQVEGSS